MAWFVIYTKSRHEKLVAEKLRSIGINVYCPLLKVRRQWSDRVKMVEEPLFRSYCFVRLDEQDRAKVFGVVGVVRYLFWLKKPAVVRDEEIEVLKTMLSETDHQHIAVTRFRPGYQATIASGSFTSAAGKVVRQQGKIVTIILDAMQVAITVDLDKTAIV